MNPPHRYKTPSSPVEMLLSQLVMYAAIPLVVVLLTGCSEFTVGRDFNDDDLYWNYDVDFDDLTDSLGLPFMKNSARQGGRNYAWWRNSSQPLPETFPKDLQSAMKNESELTLMNGTELPRVPVKVDEPKLPQTPINMDEPEQPHAPIKMDEPKLPQTQMKMDEPERPQASTKMDEPEPPQITTKVHPPAAPIMMNEPQLHQTGVKMNESEQPQAPIRINEPKLPQAPIKMNESELRPAAIKMNGPELPHAPIKMDGPELPHAPIKMNGPELPHAPIKMDGPELPHAPIKMDGPELPHAPIKMDGPELPHAPIKMDEPELPHAPIKMDEPELSQAPKIVDGSKPPPDPKKMNDPALTRATQTVDGTELPEGLMKMHDSELFTQKRDEPKRAPTEMSGSEISAKGRDKPKQTPVRMDNSKTQPNQHTTPDTTTINTIYITYNPPKLRLEGIDLAGKEANVTNRSRSDSDAEESDGEKTSTRTLARYETGESRNTMDILHRGHRAWFDRSANTGQKPLDIRENESKHTPTAEPNKTVTTINNIQRLSMKDKNSNSSISLTSRLWMYGSPPLIVGGTVGNMLSIVVLLRRSLRQTTTSLYLIALAVGDTTVLHSGLLRHWVKALTNTDIRLASNAVCKLHTFLVYGLQQFVSWIIVWVTLERLAAVFCPFKARDIFTKPFAALTLVFTALIIICFNIQFFFTQELFQARNKKTGAGQWTCNTLYHKHREYLTSRWPWIDLSIFSLVPFIIILVCNISIVCRLLLSSHRRRQLQLVPASSSGGSGHGTGAACGNSKLTTMTSILLCVSIMFLCTTAPISIFLIGQKYWPANPDPQTQERLQSAWVIVNLVSYTNNSLNFVLYCLSGRRFRKEVVSMFAFYRSTRVHPITVETLEVPLGDMA